MAKVNNTLIKKPDFFFSTFLLTSLGLFVFGLGLFKINSLPDKVLKSLSPSFL